MNHHHGSLSTVLGQHFPPFIVFSVQFATELTSRAAPRTVLQAARTIAVPISTTVVTFWNIVLSSSVDELTPRRRNGSVRPHF